MESNYMINLDVSNRALTWNIRLQKNTHIRFQAPTFQMADEPIVVDYPQTIVNVMFDNPTILIETEELAYPLSSLVADCGGVLGLFVGFNFLMIWDFLCYGIQKITPHCKHGKNKV